MLKATFFVLFSFLSFEMSFAAEVLSNDYQLHIEKANAGDAESQFKIGSAFDTGNGVPRDGEKAMEWYLSAAKSGMAEAQNSVGSGLQAEKKYKEAFMWYTKAAEQNHLVALNNLAYLYDLGLGTKQDRKKAFELYVKSANLGWPEAMWNLANMYGAGSIGEKDLYSACIWSLRAKKYAVPNNEKLNATIARTVSYLERTLGSGEFIKCQTESEAWSPK